VAVRDETRVLGGAGNVARNVVALGARVSLVSLVGDDDAGRQARVLIEALGVDPAGLVMAAGRPTTRKTRVVARGQQVVRFDRESTDPVPPKVAEQVVAAVARCAGLGGGAVIEDYGKGALSEEVARGAMGRLREAGMPVVVDPKGSLDPYLGAALVKPNLREAEALAGIRIRGDADLREAALRIQRAIGGGEVVITRGAEGMAWFDRSGEGQLVPTVTREVFDVQGAGDTTIAALAVARLAGATSLEAAVLANAAAGVVVAKVGTATADRAETQELLDAAVEAAAAGGTL
jgi:D-beta-D-heptose 7-phosphate kinase/D-beta-D-heptose 1-phosphate adenosyltransferase